MKNRNGILKVVKNLAVKSVLVGAVISMQNAQAVSSYDLSSLTSITTDHVNSLLQTIAVGGAHHAYMPATALGVLIGVDAGVDVTSFSLPSGFTDALVVATGKTTAELPTSLFIPKLNIHKGLPGGIDLGISWVGISDSGKTVLSAYGGDLKWSVINNLALPSVAVRLGYTSTVFSFLSTKTLAADVSVSKNLILLDPFLGAGVQRWSGALDTSAGTGTLGVSSDGSGYTSYMYGGAMLKLGFLKLVAQADYNTAGITSYGGKFSFGF